jgi:hypothetical protein
MPRGNGSGAFKGDGYSLTALGREWCKTFDPGISAPIEPGRYAQVIEPFTVHLGPAFRQRALEASATFRLGHYLAACAMAGAACESAVLAAAIARLGSEAKALKIYGKPTGRREIVDAILEGLPPGIGARVRPNIGILLYWRDEAAHGIQSNISEFEAHSALTQLLRLAQTLHVEWDRWAATPSPTA